MTAYDDQNVFAKILRGEIPCYKVYENQRTLGVSGHHAPLAGSYAGDTQSRRRAAFSISHADDFAEVARTAKKIAIAAVKAFDAEGIIVQQFSEAASGQVVFHLHMHVMPMTYGRRAVAGANPQGRPGFSKTTRQE